MAAATGLNRLVDDVRGLDVNNLGGWPKWVYVVCIILLVAALGYGGFHYFIKPKQEELRQAEARELSLRKEFEKKQKKVANLDAYREQLKEMERRFGKMLRQLPSKAEIANLLTDISHTRAAAGLDEELFQPLGETPRDFYAEVPTKMVVVGNYHQLATFISGISSMPRIVTVHNISINPAGSTNTDTVKLRMSLVVKTYRYLDENELSGGGK
ncbi:MAG: type 4a pilus biogenesis protein PilO [Nevskiales bacterium]